MNVIFRKNPDGEVTAVFPDEPWSPGLMTCYARVGQHSGCSTAWYRTTKPATLAEYSDLMDELIDIYSTGEDAVTLVPRKRMSRS